MKLLGIKSKRGESLLMENIMFILITAVFLAILITFLVSKMNSLAIYEEIYAKKIALILDYAKPEMKIEINLDDIMPKEKLEKEGISFDGSVFIQGNLVNVKLYPEGKGYSYAFFSDVKITSYYYSADRNSYVFIIGGYN